MTTNARRVPRRPTPSRKHLRRVKATYHVVERHNRLVRRWHTQQPGLVPARAHARYATTRDGRSRLLGFEELMCQHSGDFDKCIANASSD